MYLKEIWPAGVDWIRVGAVVGFCEHGYVH